MRRLFIILLYLLCIIFNAYADFFAKLDGANYYVTEGGAKLNYVSPSDCLEIKNKGTFTIPDSVTSSTTSPYGGKTLPVVAIGEEAFLYVKDKAFKLQGGNLVERVEKRAFKDCTKMTGFIETKSLSYIGYQAFSNCDALWAINILPEYYDLKIDESAFSYCDILTYVNTLTYAISIPDKVTSIGDYAFYNTAIQSVTIGLSLKTIGKDVFKGCSQLASVIWNAKRMDLSQTSVDVFNNLESIKTFTFGDKVEDIPANLCQG